MKTISAIVDYLYEINPISKRIMKSTLLLAFLLYVISMYFAMSAGRTTDYYASMEVFYVLVDNAKSVLGLGFFFALLFEPIYKSKRYE